MTSYDATFFEYVNAGSLRSAKRLLPLIVKEVKISSVLDVGCGQGAWLSIWRELGVLDIAGVDGNYVARDRLLIPDQQFFPHDLSIEFDLERPYDLVQSLEVAEHLPVSSAAGFVASLVRHGELVLFSAAPKGQGGDGHVNEQSYDYWRDLFAEHGYRPIDFVRPLIQGMSDIEPWYRFNTVLYASTGRFASLPPKIQKASLEDGTTIPDLSPQVYKLRKLIVRCLPVPVMTAFAKLKERLTLKAISMKAR